MKITIEIECKDYDRVDRLYLMYKVHELQQWFGDENVKAWEEVNEYK